eukprot:6712178-Karenia_brevis.AAC.1
MAKGRFPDHHAELEEINNRDCAKAFDELDAGTESYKNFSKLEPSTFTVANTRARTDRPEHDQRAMEGTASKPRARASSPQRNFGTWQRTP